MAGTVSLRTFVCLLRGINVGRSPRIAMSDLRALCEKLGWRDVRTYIQSGNIVLRSAREPRQLEADLEAAVPGRFGVSPAVIVRGAEEWAEYAATNPFVEEARVNPNLVMLAVSKTSLAETVLTQLEPRVGSEVLARVGDVLWIHYAGGSGKSRLTPGTLDKAAGSPVTTRNWRTVLSLRDLAQQ
jgi:uncharacterized protein (DUF1697 family)